MKNSATVAVIGGGASGMAAAVTAARRGAFVTVFEAQSAPGNKLLVTGNGRCNLSNTEMGPSFYHSTSDAEKRLISSILSEFPTESIICFFESLGLLVKEGREKGCLYPVTMQASTVRAVLLSAMQRFGVKIVTDSHIDSISLHNIIKRYDKVIISTGSNAGLPKKTLDLLCDKHYSLPQSLGHDMIAPLPALTAVRLQGKSLLKKLAGIRVNAYVSFYDGELIASDSGEVQLTDYGISGIAVFNGSHAVAKALADGRTVTARLDFLPFIDGDLTDFTKKRMNIFHIADDIRLSPKDYFTGLINEKLARAILAEYGIDYDKKQSIEHIDFFVNCTKRLKVFEAKAIAVNGLDKAQAAAGGIDCAQIKPSLESAIAPGVYFCGEVIDVDGICGGYNLHWAWASGMKAGRLG